MKKVCPYCKTEFIYSEIDIKLSKDRQHLYFLICPNIECKKAIILN